MVSKEDMRYAIERLWAIRGSYQSDERPEQKKAWAELIDFLEGKIFWPRK